MSEIEQATEREACRKAFEFDLIDNWMYVESDFALDEKGLHVESELDFAWECAWASWQAARAITSAPPVAGQCRFSGANWSECSPEHVSMVLKNPEEWLGYEVRYLYAAPLADRP